MVYCGKPSKGCSNCRERKIRCDQKEPGCGQCDKRQQKCPGYRNLVDLMFRDESSHVINKAKARARKKANLRLSPPATPSDSESRLSVTPEPRTRPLSLVVPPTPALSSSAGRNIDDHDDSSMLMSPESGSWPVTPPIAQLYNLAPTCQEDGFAWFFSRYVTQDETVPHQKFDFVREVWQASSSLRDDQVDSVLASMTAVGLMGMASTTRSLDLMDAARKAYGTALRLTNRALQDPAEAVKDSTMLSVLVLGVFEMMTENTQRSTTMEAFRGHVRGAKALAVMRGPAQFRTRAGRRMFSMLCQRYVVSCVQRNEPMPDCLIELWHEMSKTAKPGSPSEQLMPLVWKVLQVRSERNNHFLTDPQTIVNRLLSIDEEFENLTTQISSSWKYRVFQVKQHHPAVFGGFCHLYKSLHHANVWNHILTARILLLETVLSEISQDLASFSPTLDSAHYLDVYHKARRRLKYLVRDITASVPHQLGLMNPADGSIGNTEADDDGAAPIATVEIRETPSPPTSPAFRSSDSSSSTSSPPSISEPRRHHQHRPSGLTIFDVTKARDAKEEAERYMLLVSATSTLVWPLFVVGMSTACTAEMRAYVVGRLRTLYMETGIQQADGVANLLEECEVATEESEPGAGTGVGPWVGVETGPGIGPGWLDVGFRAGGEEGTEDGVPGVVGEEEYGSGPLPITSPDVMKGGFDLVWA